MSKIVGILKNKRTFSTLALLLLLSVALAACGGGSKETPSSSSGSATSSTSAPAAKPVAGGAQTAKDTVVVTLSNYSYDPKVVRIKPGTTVTFVNEDNIAHDVVQTTPGEVLAGNYAFESPQILPGSQWSKTFDQPGSYPILCIVEAHYLLGMTGEIIVE